jgi:hypothetical protein
MGLGNVLATQTMAVQTARCWDLNSMATQKKSASGEMSRNLPDYAVQTPRVATTPVSDTMSTTWSFGSIATVQTPLN